MDPNRGEELANLAEPVRRDLDATHRAREEGLAACRRTIRACGQAIRAVHRAQPERAAELTGEAGEALRSAQQVLAPHPPVAFAGFLQDAEKEYAEALITAALVAGDPVPSRDAIGVGLPAWLNGLAEAASELRRHILDALRHGEVDEAERCLGSMEDIYDLLVTIDYPDAMTGGLRRTTDALRAVLERTRADVTMTMVQGRLRAAIERQMGEDVEGAG